MPALKPTSDCDPRVTGLVRTVEPSSVTVSRPLATVTTTCTVAFRSGSTLTLVLIQCSWSLPGVSPPSLMPTKFPEGFAAFWKVSSATAIPGIPENPSPPPFVPRDVDVAPRAGSASTKARPSAPVPESMLASKLALR